MVPGERLWRVTLSRLSTFSPSASSGAIRSRVFPDARGLSDAEMQALAAELNLSETTYVLLPADLRNTARVRIFNRTEEMAFAGHPCIGTAFVLARAALFASPTLRLEVPAGLVPVEIDRKEGVVVGGRLTAPRPLEVGRDYPADKVAACVGLAPEDVLVDAHPPIAVSMGNPYVVVQVKAEALARCVPDLRAFRAFRARHTELGSRFSLHLYAGDGPELRARMFAPLAGTIEDPATGSANAPLVGLLLSIRGAEFAQFVVRQGEEMGRPSVLHLTARRERDGIAATVAGRCVPVLSGVARVGEGLDLHRPDQRTASDSHDNAKARTTTPRQAFGDDDDATGPSRICGLGKLLQGSAHGRSPRHPA